MYKVFYNNALIIIAKPFEKIEGVEKQQITNAHDLSLFIGNYLAQTNPADTHIYGYEIVQLWADFKSYFKCIVASGGMVKNQEGDFLFIKRFGIWDLPKGKMEDGENPISCALREVEEETAVSALEIIDALCLSYHIYHLRNEWVLKETNWYLMHTVYEGKLIPQIKEDILEVKWLAKDKAKLALASSYRSLFECLQGYLQ